MIVSIQQQRKDFNDHIKFLCNLADPNDKELMFRFVREGNFTNKIEENYFYDFTRAFEAYLYIVYDVDASNFRYYRPE